MQGRAVFCIPLLGWFILCKFKAGDIAGTDDMDGVKTGYGELEGFFGGGRAAGSAVGVYYNDFTVAGGEGDEKYGDGFAADDLWGAYASVNFGNWNAPIRSIVA